MTTEELHKYLTQHGVCLMGKVQREYLVEQVKKLRVYSDLGPVDRIMKILPEVKDMKTKKEKINRAILTF